MGIIMATFKVAGDSPYSCGKYFEGEKAKNQSYEDFEKNHWKEKLHVDKKGIVFIPAMAIKLALENSAQFLGTKVKGKRNATYTKSFKSGVLPIQDISLGIHIDDSKKVYPEMLFVPSDGKRGGSSRVVKHFPRIDQWSGEAALQVSAPDITKDIFLEMLKASGQFIGLGRFRPQNGGFYGRYHVEDVKWTEV